MAVSIWAHLQLKKRKNQNSEKMCDGPEEPPPPGRFGFKKHAGLIRVKLAYRQYIKLKSRYHL